MFYEKILMTGCKQVWIDLYATDGKKTRAKHEKT